MAHADYDCCAICDDKLGYNPYGAGSKRVLCSSCITAMANEGIMIPDVHALIMWIRNAPARDVKKILRKVGFRACCYYNLVDEEVMKKGCEFNEDGSIK